MINIRESFQAERYAFNNRFFRARPSAWSTRIGDTLFFISRSIKMKKRTPAKFKYKKMPVSHFLVVSMPCHIVWTLHSDQLIPVHDDIAV